MKKRVPLKIKLMRKAWAKGDAQRDKDNKKPDNLMEYNNIVYSDNEAKSSLNLYRPKDGEGKVLPVVVSIHGGGYFYGSKELYSYYCMYIASKGYAVIDFDYRLAPEYLFPAPLIDTNDVFKWVCKNASEYLLDTNNVFLTGDSAGSQLVSQYTAIYSNKEYSALFDLEVPSFKIRAVNLCCGMYDIPKRVMTNDANSFLMNNYLGENYDSKDSRLDVLNYIDETYPPVFIFSACNDFLVSECEPMASFLKSKGIEVESKIYGDPEKKEIAHVFHLDFRYPEGETARQDIVAFFSKHIK